MVNSGIINVGVTTKYHYSSLMDHLGSGSPWDLQRKNYGLFVLPPYMNYEQYGFAAGNIDILLGIMPYLRRSRQKYVVLSEGHTICNMTFNEALKKHKNLGADVTIIYNVEQDHSVENLSRYTMLELGENDKVIGIEHKPMHPKTSFASMDMFIMEKDLLIRLIEGCVARGEHNFVMDALIRNQNVLKIFGVKFDGYVGRVDSVNAYFANNMNILREDVRTQLFGQSNLVYTKIKNQVPSKYGEDAKVVDSLIADGAVIEGEVYNSIIFRGVHIGRGATIRNSILMEKTYVEDNCDLEYVILDKECIIRGGKRLIGQENYPVIIRKKAIV